MGLLNIEDVTHWSIPVNNLEESEEFYGEFLGLEHVGRLGNSRMTCYKVAEHRILLCEVPSPLDPPTGSSFHPRCPMVLDQCSRDDPALEELAPGHRVSCHLY